jgi:hypothetical protein
MWKPPFAAGEFFDMIEKRKVRTGALTEGKKVGEITCILSHRKKVSSGYGKQPETISMPGTA